MEYSQLEGWSAVDVSEISREELADIGMVHIDVFSPVTERMDSYLKQVQNPYCFLCGEIPVKLSFPEEDHTLGEQLRKYFASRKRG